MGALRRAQSQAEIIRAFAMSVFGVPRDQVFFEVFVFAGISDGGVETDSGQISGEEVARFGLVSALSAWEWDPSQKMRRPRRVTPSMSTSRGRPSSMSSKSR